MPLARDWNTPMTDEAVPACSRASLMACAPELPKMNAFAVIMSAKPTHVGMSGRSRRNVDTASVTTPVAAIVRPVMMSVRGVKCEIRRTLTSANPVDSSALNAKTHAKAMGDRPSGPCRT